MAVTRLNKHSRELLERLVQDKVRIDPDKLKQIYETRASFVKQVVALHHRVFTPEVISTLKKLDMHTNSSTLRFCIENHDPKANRAFTIESMYLSEFKDNADIPDTISVPDYSYSYRVKGMVHLTHGKKLANMFYAMEDALSTLKSENEKLKHSYYMLIKASKTFEQVVEVWSEASEIASQITGVGTGVSLLSEDLKARIAKDTEDRKAREAANAKSN